MCTDVLVACHHLLRMPRAKPMASQILHPNPGSPAAGGRCDVVGCCVDNVDVVWMLRDVDTVCTLCTAAKHLVSAVCTTSCTIVHDLVHTGKIKRFLAVHSCVHDRAHHCAQLRG